MHQTRPAKVCTLDVEGQSVRCIGTDGGKRLWLCDCAKFKERAPRDTAKVLLFQPCLPYTNSCAAMIWITQDSSSRRIARATHSSIFRNQKDYCYVGLRQCRLLDASESV